ncbi:DUF3237 domain-containing protein [Flavobacteriaceae bacterium XHP0103]|uniref:DUF3237 family protein n=1 Tax=Marixanthotalea marina TaxID=2844359 RepID=UPI002989E1F2|nr:DUF3237 family protein [Marixanthotalea marina]MBU3822068.1 DUF3237 domain-containing protein [Marixanthotalea marina]
MNDTIMTEKKLLFEETINLTGLTEYGFPMCDLIAGKPIPPEGARFDINFEGDVEGERINGKIKGIDYLEVRSDGRFFLTLHATITTSDGANIKVEEIGNNKNGELKLFMKFHSSDKKYAWLNNQDVIGNGFVDLKSGEAKVNGYLI